jgi:ZIP family zinc transporter
MLNAFLLSLLAGLATGLGGLLVLLFGGANRKVIGFGLGLSSGIMVIIGIKDLLGLSLQLTDYYIAIGSFAGGALLLLAMDVLIPHEFFFKERGVESKRHFDLMKVGMIMAFGIAIHNLPEGMIVAAGYVAMPVFGIMLAAAIAIHNIPEGIAVAVPLCASGCSRKRVFTITLLSGLAEALGAVIALLFLSFVPGILPILLGFAGGVMVYITMDELIPTAKKYGSPHAISAGLILGLIIALLLGYLI